jgi:hypothetical protein
MNMTHANTLTGRQALVRIAAGLALGLALAAAVASHGSASAAPAGTTPPGGSAASQLTVLQSGPIAAVPPSGVAAGLASASADSTSVRLLGTAADGGSGVTLYASARAGGGACNALANAKGAVGTSCIETIPPAGITLGASDSDGWMVYGFAADDVVGVDVVVGGKVQPAALLRNAYVAHLGTADLSAVAALIVHHADGTVDKVPNDLRAPGS